MDNKEILWKQYQQHIETYKFYLDIVVKLVAFFFAIAGAMLSFYFANVNNESAKLALYLPWLMALGLLVFFSVGSILSMVTRQDVFNLRDKLELEVSPELGVLTLLLVIFAIVMLSCVVGLSHVLWYT